MKDTKDNFSTQAGAYAAFRPGYPQQLFDHIYSQCTAFKHAWDCATGNGQAAVHLAERFEKVYATDISDSQLDKAVRKENIIYSTGRAEQTTFPDSHFDLVTVAQAFHWLDHKAFFTEVHRVCRNGAVLAVWGYGLLHTNNAMVNKLLLHFYKEITGPYWDAERKHVDEAYSNIQVPFTEVPCPAFSMQYDWDKEQFKGYLGSWSAVQHYIKQNGHDPVRMIDKDIDKAWQPGRLTVTFPIFMRMFKVKK